MGTNTSKIHVKEEEEYMRDSSNATPGNNAKEDDHLLGSTSRTTNNYKYLSISNPRRAGFGINQHPKELLNNMDGPSLYEFL